MACLLLQVFLISHCLFSVLVKLKDYLLGYLGFIPLEIAYTYIAMSVGSLVDATKSEFG